MRKLVLVFLLSIGVSSISQIEISNTQYSFGGTQQDDLVDVVSVSDGYIILLNSSSGINGNKTVGGFGSEDFWLVKTDFSMNIVWQKVYGGDAQDRPFDLLALSDGNFLLSGLSFSGVSGTKTTINYGYEDFYIIKVDGLGNIIWDKSFGGDSLDVALDVAEMNNELYICGETISGVSGNKTTALKSKYDNWILKIDLNGTKIWEKTLGGDESDRAPSMITYDNKVFIASQSNSTSSFDKSISTYGDSDNWIFVLDTTGLIINQNNFGGVDYEASPKLYINGEKLFLSSTTLSANSANKTSTNYGVTDYWLLKLDTSLNVEFDKVYGGDDSDECYGLSFRNNGEMIIYGRSRSNISGIKTTDSFDPFGTPVPKYDMWIIGLDSNGNDLWQTLFGGVSNDHPVNVIENTNYTLNIFGYSSSISDGNKTSVQYGSGDGWVIKLETNLAISEESIEESIIIYPNPSTGTMNISIPEFDENYTMRMYNMQGKLENQYKMKGNFNSVNLLHLQNGIYFLEIAYKSQFIRKKISIIK